MGWLPTDTEESLYPFGWRLHVNDVVHSFCYRCRNPWPTQQAYWKWPFVLLENWPAYPTNYGPYDHALSLHKEFLLYWIHHDSGFTESAASTLQALFSITVRWTNREFNYADYLLRTYYQTPNQIPKEC